MREISKNIRFYVLVISFIFSIGVYWYIKTSVPSGTIQTIKLTQIYALASLFFLYFALLATPITRYFQFLPFRGEYIKARRALGVSAFYFALLHVYNAFFKQLGGFVGLSFLSNKYLIAISVSFVALLIFLAMSLTATDSAIEKIGFKKWKLLHRLVYLAGTLVLVHALMLGTHFVDLSANIPKIFFVSLTFLLILQAKRLDEWVQTKIGNWPSFGLLGLFTFSACIYFLSVYVFSLDPTSGSLGIHSQHILQANKDAQSGGRLNVVINTQNFPLANKKVKLEFKVTNATSGEVLKEFSINQEKIMHLIIVDENLNFFDHIHPELENGIFTVDYTFPKDGLYRIYTDFMPKGMSEQYFAFQVEVGKHKSQITNTSSEIKLTDVVGNTKATITLPPDFSAKNVGSGNTLITFKLENLNGEDIKTIEPYLGAFGHLVMIKQDTFDYIHVHPKQKYEPYEGQTTGPIVEFSPLSIYGNVKPGLYKLFGQFKIDGKDYVFDFLIKLK